MHNVRFDAEKGIVWITVSGPLNKDYATEFTTEAAKIAQENNCQKLLFDIRDTLITEFLGNVLDYIANIESVGLKKSYKIATVYSVDEEKNLLYNQAMKEQGFNDQLFKDLDEAINWLNEDQ